MRRKITAKPTDDGAELPVLTEKQQRFVELLLAGNTASDAYRGAYDTSNMQPLSVNREACILRMHPNISQWLAIGRKSYLGSQIVTLKGHLAELENLRQIAIETGNVGAAVQAEQLRGKAAGHYVERLEVRHDDPTAILRELASVSPALASAYAQQNNLDWDKSDDTQH